VTLMRTPLGTIAGTGCLVISVRGPSSDSGSVGSPSFVTTSARILRPAELGAMKEPTPAA
jgi:hypothetical protein